MNQITDGPNEYDFGLDFNYAAWTQETVITLTNVPWNNDYRDVVKFANVAALNSYINGKASTNTRIENASYAKTNMPVRLEIPFNKAMRYNYLRASNPVQPIPGDIQRDYFYFITDVRYIAPNTTEVVIQIDVFQSFGYDITFGRCYVERGHIGIANQDNFADYGRKYLAVPEGLDIGNEYQVASQANKRIMQAPVWNGSNWIQTSDAYSVMVVTTTKLSDGGTVTDPKMESAEPTITYGGLPSGAMVYYARDGFWLWLAMSMLASTPWLTQGIVGIYIIPNIKSIYPDVVWPEFGSSEDAWGMIKAGDLKKFISPANDAVNILDNWREDLSIKNKIPSRYRHLKKFFTFPYMTIEVTAWNGSPLNLKPECWNSPHARFSRMLNLTPPAMRIAWAPRYYNSKNTDENGLLSNGEDFGEFLNATVTMDNFPSVPVVNNMAIGALASQAHGLAQQRANADWSQQKALGANQNSYDIANSGIAAQTNLMAQANSHSKSMTDMNNAFAMGNSIINAGAGVGGGAVQGMVAGPAGAAIGAVGAAGAGLGNILSTGIGIHQANIGQSLGALNNMKNNQISTSQQGYVADTNKSLADWAAKGDYAATIGSIEAKVQDAALNQPSISGQFGGDYMNIANDNARLSVRWKMLSEGALARIGEYWLRYGYAVNWFTTPPANLQVMTKFTYWKMQETYITSGPMPEPFKQAIRGIFEKGVTVWKNPADIGNTDPATNTAIAGVTL